MKLNSSISEAKLKNTIFNKIDFTNSQIFNTNLNKIDFSNCNIEGIIIGREDLKGMIVNEFQALELSKLLGIIIK